jgi:6-pyruvoyltetrahydropterin/6-carboxytetrahydropterin synthase
VEAQFADSQVLRDTLMHELSQRFMFEAAHTLHRAFDTASSQRVHGHTYYAEIAVAGAPDKHIGMIMDLALLRAGIEEIRAKLDHRMLDDVEGLGPPTLENLSSYIANQLTSTIPQITSVRVWREGSGDTCRLTISQ